MLLKNKHEGNANMKVNLPVVGEVKLENGVVDVPKEVHDMLIGDGLNEWTSGEESVEEGTDSTTSDEYEEMVNGLTFEEVQTLAKDAKMKGYQMFKKESTLKAYVIKKLRDADAEEKSKIVVDEDAEDINDDDSENTGSPEEETE